MDELELPMRKTLDFHSSRAWYECDAALVTCFDSRFDPICSELLKQLGVAHPDTIKIAGGAKSLASPEEEFHRTFVLDQLKKSIQLHGTRRVILTLHSDCGGYGRLFGRFQGDAQAEMAHCHEELERARRFLEETVPALQVECFFLNFEGAWAVDTTAAAPA
jgi:carbonic anhydrase